MELDDFIEKAIFAAYMVSFILSIYLILGNGLIGLSVLQLSYPYRAMVAVPALGMYVGTFGLFLIGMTLIKNKKLKRTLAVLEPVLMLGFVGLRLSIPMTSSTDTFELILLLGVFLVSLARSIIEFREE